jgi:hypothetical protein
MVAVQSTPDAAAITFFRFDFWGVSGFLAI